MHNGAVATRARESVHRQTVALPAATARRVKALAREKRTSASQMLAQLVEIGLDAEQSRREQFLKLARQFRAASDPSDAARLGEELGRMVFGG